MGLVPRFNQASIRKHIDEQVRRIKEAALLRLQRVGENFVNNARSMGSYTDRTGNLRSSKGYVVLDNGKQVYDGGFVQGIVGKVAGKKVLSEVSLNYPTGLVLICVAGMHYAAAVEAKGKDVITGSSQLAITELKQSMAELSKKVQKMK